MIVCLSGYKQSGKDMLAAYLIEKHGAKRVGLADPLKDMVAEEYGIDRASLDDPKTKESPLLNLPVDPKDGFTKMMAEFMVKEFRSEGGDQPNAGFEFTPSGKFLGRFLHTGGSTYATAPLFHTPRSLAIFKGSGNRFVRSDYWTNKALDKIEDLHDNKKEMVVVSDVRYKSELAQFSERLGDSVVFVRINRHKESPSSDPSERDLDDTKFDFYVENTTTKESAYGQLEAILTKARKVTLV